MLMKRIRSEGNMSHKIILPRVMHIGKGASQRVAETLKGLNCHKPLLVTDKVMVELGYSAAIVQAVSYTHLTLPTILLV